MRVLIINCVCGIRSTGRICTELADQFRKRGDEVRIAYGRMEEVPEQYREIAVRIGNRKDLALHLIRTRLFDQHGFGSKLATHRFLQWAESYQPDLVWLHNIHGYYLNIELLFDWIKCHPEMRVKWTLHDCWAFTGHCAYFTAAGCEQWQNGCSHCPQLQEYPCCYGFSSVKKNFERKQKAFTGVSNMQLITPSQWLADLVKKSFLQEYPVEVHYNTVNTRVFHPTESHFREQYHLQDNFIVLGVASTWDTRKGLSDFIQLAQMLDERYAVVLVGLTGKQIRELQGKIRDNRCRMALSGIEKSTDCVTYRNETGDVAITPNVYSLYYMITDHPYLKNEVKRGGCRVMGLPKTNHAEELAGIYTTADVFVNPTYEDNYPTVNLEARACGTRVITYDIGGCRETLMQK